MALNSLTRCKPLLGTYIEITLQGKVSQSELITLSNTAFSAIEHIQNLMSFHDASSELSKINQQAADEYLPISSDMMTVLKEALMLSEASNGTYDISVANQLVNNKALPSPNTTHRIDQSACWRDIELTHNSVHFHKPLLIDLGGIAKGYAVDCAIASLEGKVDATINAGGDLFMTQWQGESTLIRQASGFIEIPMQAPALATSASYFLDDIPSVIYPPSEQTPKMSSNSYSVFANTCMRADALTKIAYLDPTSGPLIEKLGAMAIVIDTAGSIQTL